MAWRLARCGLLMCLPVVILLISLGCLPRGGSAMGLPKPQLNVNFTIAVEGGVWCKSCRYPGYLASKDASPLPDAVAMLRCRRGKWKLTEMGGTDARGYFRVQTPKQVRAVTSKDCKVYVTSPVRACGVAVKPARNKGATLKFRKVVSLDDGVQALYTVGDFLFGQQDPSRC